jgi:hypothetical protein
MDYIYEKAIIVVNSDLDSEKKQLYRLEQYNRRLSEMRDKKAVCKDTMFFDKYTQLAKFWEKEIQLEQKIYMKMKAWDRRHPIIDIIFCTILIGILTSLVAGIILEALK